MGMKPYDHGEIWADGVIFYKISNSIKFSKQYKRPAIHFYQTADSDTVSTYQVFSAQLVTNK